MTTLFDDERLDYLITDERLQIIQSPTIFSYSLDAILLAHFAYMPINKGNILDLCTGNGIVPLLLSARTKGNIVGIEIQERIMNMAKRSIELNELTNKITIIHGDLRENHPLLHQSYFDVVTCNPPYFTINAKAQQNDNEYLTIARHEICCTLEDVVKACKRYVKPNGKVAIVHRPERLVDIITLFRAYNIEPKRIQFVYPKKGREANTLLVEGIRDGGSGLKILEPLYIYQDDNTYTKEAKEIIYGE